MPNAAQIADEPQADPLVRRTGSLHGPDLVRDPLSRAVANAHRWDRPLRHAAVHPQARAGAVR